MLKIAILSVCMLSLNERWAYIREKMSWLIVWVQISEKAASHGIVDRIKVAYTYIAS